MTIGVRLREGIVKPTRIGRNPYEGLVKLRRLETGQWYWIDALCIDQSNLSEKNAQVALMAAIYTKSALVVIWLGSGDLEPVASFFQDLNQFLYEYEREHGPVPPDKVGYMEGTGMSVTDVTFSDEVVRAVWDFFAQRRYFSRVWIAQEIALAKEASVLLGQQLIPLFVLARVQKFVASKDFTMNLVRRTSEELFGNGEEIFQTWRGYHLGESLTQQRATGLEYLKLNFDVRGTDDASWYAGMWLVYLGTMQRRFASNPRDHIYALASMIAVNTPSGIETITFDCSQPVEDVYEDFTVRLLHALDNLSVLSLVCTWPDVMVLPSFVPDYRFSGRHKPLLTSLPAVGGRLPPVMADEARPYRTFRVVNHELHIFGGHKIGNIEIARKIHKVDPKTAPPVGTNHEMMLFKYQDSFLSWLEHFFFVIELSHEIQRIQDSNQSMLLTVFRVLCYSAEAVDGLTASTFAKRRRNDIMMNLLDMGCLPMSELVNEKMEEAKLLFAQYASEGLFPAVEEVERGLAAAKNAKFLMEAIQKAEVNGEVGDFLEKWENTPELKSFYEFRDALNTLATKRAPPRHSEYEVDFVFYCRGYVGRITCEVQKGDEVWVMDGARVPFILRRQGEKHRLLCEAFIPGLMYWGDLTRVKGDSEKVVLV